MKSYQKTIFIRQIFIALVTYLSTTMLDASVNLPFNEDALNRLSMLSINSPSRPSSITLDNPENTSFSPLVNIGGEELTHTPEKTVRILSFDGGGTRGIIEAEIIRLLEESLNERRKILNEESNNEKHLYLKDAFDLIGGTSAGGILATFLTTPKKYKSSESKYTAENLVEILYTKVESMFVPRFWSCGGIFGPKYRSDTLQKALENELGNDTTNNTTKPTAVLTYDLKRQRPKLITSWEKETFKKVDAMMASAAAPSFFSPCKISAVLNRTKQSPTMRELKSYNLIDGGIVANNPSQYLLDAAKKLYPNATKFEIVSIGSGHADKPILFEDMENASIFHWAPRLPGIFINAQTVQINTNLQNTFGEDYIRLSPTLSREDVRLDNISKAHIEILIAKTRIYFDSQKSKIDLFINRLLEEKTELL